ncbi:MAG TPA: Virginiamycin B lyase, partial [Candidatus Dormibacteraeota bacterium]|nr:Virginiamycin B lyase [Candidatus Dormibacteraeota bacterium]
NKVGRVSTSGLFTEYPVPTPGSVPNDIAVDRDGNAWFIEADANKVARITTSGMITEFPLPAAQSYPTGVVAGPDGNVWVTERLVNKIAKIVVREPSSNQAAITVAAVVLGAAIALTAVLVLDRKRRRNTPSGRGVARRG